MPSDRIVTTGLRLTKTLASESQQWGSTITGAHLLKRAQQTYNLIKTAAAKPSQLLTRKNARNECAPSHGEALTIHADIICVGVHKRKPTKKPPGAPGGFLRVAVICLL